MTYNELYHHGILGQKWGVRRYQNADGTLTSAGKRRYEKDLQKAQKQYDKKIRKNYVKIHNKTAERINSITAEFNKRYDEKNGGEDWVQRLGMNSKEYKEYVDAYNTEYSKIFTEECIKMLGERPT